jgi:uncharacterized protein
VTRPLVGVALLAGMLAGGCGSSGEPETTQTDPESDVLERMPEVPAPSEASPPPGSLRDVFEDVQAMWRREFEAAGAGYTPATLTIFRDEVGTACGTESAKVGPFYCPADHGVYLDTRFFDALARTAGVELGTSRRPTSWPTR